MIRSRALRMGAILAAAITGTAGARALTPAEALSGMEKTWSGTSAYTCRMHVMSHRGVDSLQQDFVYEFRKPRLIRLKVLSGANRGADVVYDRDGRVRGAKRVMGIRFKETMSVKDPMFRDLRGVPFWQADLGSQVEYIRHTLLLPGASGSVTPDRAGGYALTVHYRDTDPYRNGARHDFVDEWSLDRTTFFPMRRTLTEDGVDVEEVTVTDVNLNADLPESRFRL